MDDKRSAVWPAEIRSAAILGNEYAQLVFREQQLLAIADLTEDIRKNGEEAIAEFKKLGGIVETVTDEFGHELSHDRVFRLGSSEWTISFDKDGNEAMVLIAIDPRAELDKRNKESELIARTYLAIKYAGAPEKARKELLALSKDDRSGKMVIGIHQLGDIARRDSTLLDHAITGAHISKESVDGA